MEPEALDEAETRLEMEHMEFFRDPSEGEGVLGGVAKHREEDSSQLRMSSITCSLYSGRTLGLEMTWNQEFRRLLYGTTSI